MESNSAVPPLSLEDDNQSFQDQDGCPAPMQGPSQTDNLPLYADGPTVDIHSSTMDTLLDPVAVALSITLERTFVVKEMCLDKLLQCFLCMLCHKPTKNITKSLEGDESLLVTVLCPSGHEILVWSSSHPEQIKFQREIIQSDPAGPTLDPLQDVPVQVISRPSEAPCNNESPGDGRKVDQEIQTDSVQGTETSTTTQSQASKAALQKKPAVDNVDRGTVSHFRHGQHLVFISSSPYVNPGGSAGEVSKVDLKTLSKNGGSTVGHVGGFWKWKNGQALPKGKSPGDVGGDAKGGASGGRQRQQPTKDRSDKTTDSDTSRKEDGEATEDADITLKKQKTCQHCGRVMSSILRREIHERIHTGEKPFKCQNCPKAFASEEAFVAHRVVHTGEKPFGCSKCDMKFPTRHYLRYHLREHGNRTPFECSYCGKEFKSSSAAKKHMKDHHSQETEHHCKSCQEKFQSREAFLKHSKKHRQESALEAGVVIESSDEEDLAAGCAHSTLDGMIEEEGASMEGEVRKTTEVETVNNVGSANGEKNFGQKPEGQKKLKFKCRYCEKTFTDVGLRTEHHIFHTKDLPHGCGQCDMKFAGVKECQAHEELHLLKPYRCRVCNEPFSIQEVCDEHEMTCSTRNRCKYCQRLFATWKQCKAHTDAHPKVRPFKCNTCGKGFKRKCDAKKHQVVHEEGTHLCQFCGKSFRAHEYLLIHLRGVHMAKRTLKCSYCDKKFKSQYCRRVHEQSHRGERRYKCDYCDDRFVTSIARTHHHRIHTGAFPYQCSYCQRPFRHRSALNRHVRIHTGERPYPCDFCEMRFLDLKDSRAHMFKHTGVSPHVCSYCGKSFASSGGLRRHERLHTGHKPMKCRYCDEHFMYSQSRKNHERRLHAEEFMRDKAMAEEASSATSAVGFTVPDDDVPSSLQEMSGMCSSKTAT